MTVGTYCLVNACARCTTRTCAHHCHTKEPTMVAESVECPYCPRRCGSGPGLASHIRSMHPDHARAADPLPTRPPIPPPAAPRTNGDSGGIIWEDPPSGGLSRQTLVAELRPKILELRRNPGRYARIRTYDKASSGSSTANALRKVVEFADIQFVARKLPDGTSAIWARYVEED